MQIELIDTFLDLIDSRSFNKTAERLGITQSTVSARVKSLETQVGKTLFHRSRSGTEITPAGTAFEPHARGLRHSWSEALRATSRSGNTAVALRIGLQIDLAATHIGDWVDGFQKQFKKTAFYLELDYSNQMCSDLLTGTLDFAVLYTPRYYPDLHFETLGAVRFVMVSTDATRLDQVKTHTFITANYAPAFDRQQQQMLPDLANSRVSSGLNAAVMGLITSIGGTAYVLEETATWLSGTNQAHVVTDAPILEQSVYCGFHVRHRYSHVHLKLRDTVKGYLQG